MTETIKLYNLSSETAANLTAHAQRIPAAAAATLEHYYHLVEQIEQLEAEGITNATPWYKDDKYLYLVHPTQPNGSRQREYIGADAGKQTAALARLARYRRHQELTNQANRVRLAIENALYSIDRLLSTLKDEQK